MCTCDSDAGTVDDGVASVSGRVTDKDDSLPMGGWTTPRDDSARYTGKSVEFLSSGFFRSNAPPAGKKKKVLQRRRKKSRIVPGGISGERSLTGPLSDARRFPSTRRYPVPSSTRTTLGFGSCPSFKDHSLSRRAKPWPELRFATFASLMCASDIKTY
jgi:hypothetical protein